MLFVVSCSTAPKKRVKKKFRKQTIQTVSNQKKEIIEPEDIDPEDMPTEIYRLRSRIEDLNNRVYVLTEQMESLRSRFRDTDKLQTYSVLAKEEKDQRNIVKFQTITAAMKRDYQGAYKYFKKGKFAKSLLSFSSFIEKYPNSSLTDNAYYWLGESYFEQREFALAIEEYTKIIKKFPEGSKAPDSLFRIALSYRNLGEKADADAYYKELMTRFPNSRAAMTAKLTFKARGR